MMTEPELVAELYRQTAFNAAILGGFGMTFLSVLLSVNSKGRVTLWATGAMALAAILLVVATLGSTMLLLSTQQLSLSFNFAQWPAHLMRTKLITETALFTGIFSLFLAVALSGFIKNRQTGIVTSVPAMIGACLTLVILMPTF